MKKHRISGLQEPVPGIISQAFTQKNLTDSISRRIAQGGLISPYRLRTTLTDNGVQLCHPPRYRVGPTARFLGHLFDRLCADSGIEHRLTEPNHPRINGQVERMNRTIKDAIFKRFHYADYDQLRRHLKLFLDVDNHASQLKTLRGFTPYEFVIQQWTREPKRLETDPSNHIPRPNNEMI